MIFSKPPNIIATNISRFTVPEVSVVDQSLNLAEESHEIFSNLAHAQICSNTTTIAMESKKNKNLQNFSISRIINQRTNIIKVFELSFNEHS